MIVLLTSAVHESWRKELKITQISQRGYGEKVRAYYFSFVVVTERPTKWEIKGADESHTHAL